MSHFLQNLVAKSQGGVEAVRPRRRMAFEPGVISQNFSAEDEFQETATPVREEREVVSPREARPEDARTVGQSESLTFRQQDFVPTISRPSVDPAEMDDERRAVPDAAEDESHGFQRAQRVEVKGSAAITESLLESPLVKPVELGDLKGRDELLETPRGIRPLAVEAKKSINPERHAEAIQTQQVSRSPTPNRTGLPTRPYEGDAGAPSPMPDAPTVSLESSVVHVGLIPKNVVEPRPATLGPGERSAALESGEATSSTIVSPGTAGRREHIEVASVVQPRVVESTHRPASSAEQSEVATIHVSIGRVEVRAVTPPPTPRRRNERRTPALSLDDYLKRDRRAG